MDQPTHKEKSNRLQESVLTRELTFWRKVFEMAVTEKFPKNQQLAISKLRALEHDLEVVRSRVEFDFYAEPESEDVKSLPLKKLCAILSGTTSHMKGLLEKEFLSRVQMPVVGSFMEIYYDFRQTKAVICKVGQRYSFVDVSTWNELPTKNIVTIKGTLKTSDIYRALEAPFILVGDEDI